MGNFKNKLSNYQSIPRSLIFDKNISDRARFVFCYMAAKPDGWDFYMTPMAKELGYSTDTLRKYINELIQSGWLTKGSQEITTDGRFGAVEYTLNDSPITKRPATEITDTEKTRHGKNPILTDRDNKHIDNNIDIYNRERSLSNFQKPSVEEIKSYCQERNNNVDPDTFFDFYESKGWKVGNQRMKDWKAAVRTWEKRERKVPQKERETPMLNLDPDAEWDR